MYQSGNQKNSFKKMSFRYILMLVIFCATRVMSQSIDIRLANNNTYGTNDRGAYNTSVSTVDNGGVSGGSGGSGGGSVTVAVMVAVLAVVSQ